EMSEADEQAEFTLQLARLFADAGRAEDSAYYYRKLRDEFGEQTFSGKTGKEWFAGLPSDGAVTQALEATRRSWPVGQVETTVDAKVVANTRTYSIIMGEGPSVYHPDVTFHWDQTRQAVVARDGMGRDLWQLAVQELGAS